MRKRKINNASGGAGNAVVVYVAAFISIAFDWWLMKQQLGLTYFNAVGTILKCLGDVALILIPYWLLAPRWRWCVMIPVILIPLWCIINLTYFRFWDDLIPPAAITMGGNIDGNLLGYGASLLVWTDLLFLVSAILVLAVVLIVKPALSPSFSRRTKVWLVAGSLLTGVLGQFSYFKSTSSWREGIRSQTFSENFYDHFLGGYTGQKQLYLYNGMSYYGVRFVADAIMLLNSRLELSAEERSEIADFIRRYSRSAVTSEVDTVPAPNIVYIIVESLNADMVGKRIGDIPVMPVLDSLSRMEGTVVFDNVVSQIKAASSSDGHLLLLTGLMPPEKMAYSITFGSQNTFPSLASYFPDHHKYLLLADEGVCWNEGNTLRNFSFGEPLVIKDRPQYPVDVSGCDGAMFLQAADLLKTAERPFMMTLMTISMHVPFKESAWPLPEWLKEAEGMTDADKDYANMCRETDRCIGDFLKAVPEGTIIFIASDHHQSLGSAKNPRAFFMAVNTGKTRRISRTVGQVNLFPATLEILGKGGSYGGLAPSAFNPCVDGTMDSYGKVYGSPSPATLDTLRKAARLSDIIIRGDYFKDAPATAE